MKKYIRICDCCGNTFETDKDKHTVCLFCYRKMLYDFGFWYKYAFGKPLGRHLELDKEYIKKQFGKDI